EYIVVLRKDADPRAVAAVAGVRPRFVYNVSLTGFAAALNEGQLNALRHHPAVEYVEQDQRGSVAAVTERPPRSWGLDRIDQRYLPFSGSYTYETGGGTVYAYVIDTGLQSGHTGFGGRAQSVYTYGSSGDAEDCHGHGTHVAGIIGGEDVGVSRSVLLRGVKVTDCQRGTLVSWAIAGVEWVRVNHVKPAVANISLLYEHSDALNAAVTELHNAGVFTSVGAGNGVRGTGRPACGYSPQGATVAMIVAASDSADQRPAWSNYGSCVDIYAPGVDIRSLRLNGSTILDSGTSMAAPHVTGVAASMKRWGDLSSSTMTSRILNSATPGAIRNPRTDTPNRLLWIQGGDTGKVAITMVRPSGASWGPPNTLTVAGTAQDGTGGVALLWRDVTLNGTWKTEAWAPTPAADGSWSNTIPSAYYCHDFQVQARYSGGSSPITPYTGLTSGYCNEQARVIWMQPQTTAGWGTPGALIVAGEAKGAPAGTTVTMYWRNVTTGGSFVKAPYAAPTDSNGIWINDIPNADFSQQYEAYVQYDVTRSTTCRYAGAGDITWC
ncbi:MAG TPA: S8 family peptidase, partial [Longimicrobiaceae bacterium]